LYAVFTVCIFWLHDSIIIISHYDDEDDDDCDKYVIAGMLQITWAILLTKLSNWFLTSYFYQLYCKM